MTTETEWIWIDECFRVERTRWGTYRSYDKENNPLVISLTEQLCTEATRFYLKGKVDGFSRTENSYESVVGGKL